MFWLIILFLVNFMICVVSEFTDILKSGFFMWGTKDERALSVMSVIPEFAEVFKFNPTFFKLRSIMIFKV